MLPPLGVIIMRVLVTRQEGLSTQHVNKGIKRILTTTIATNKGIDKHSGVISRLQLDYLSGTYLPSICWLDYTHHLVDDSP